ncbi:MAG: response regulator [Vicinamibacterales bacterium]
MPETTRPIRILITEDHRLVREGLVLLLERESDFKVVAAVPTGEEAVAAFQRQPVDVVLMDLQLPGIDGIEAIRRIRARHLDARIIVLTIYDGEEDIYRALDAGAATYLLKDRLPEELVDVIRQVHAGEVTLAASLAARLAGRSRRSPLSQRETDVLGLVMKGLRNKEIAELLRISEGTVQVHMKNTFVKLNVHDRTAAVYVALRLGILRMRFGESAREAI